MAKRKFKPQYTIGSLLLLLAFFFYATGHPDKKQEQPKQETNSVENHSDNDTLTDFEGKVVSIKDGDTFEVMRDGKAEKIRLVDIDSPESAQPFGKAAKNYASELCYGKEVRVEPKKKRDRYGRILGTVYVNDTLNVNAEMIKAGFAWRYKYSRKKQYGAYQDEARENRIGLWAGENPIDPWQWRKNKKNGYTNR